MQNRDLYVDFRYDACIGIAQALLATVRDTNCTRACVPPNRFIPLKADHPLAEKLSFLIIFKQLQASFV